MEKKSRCGRFPGGIPPGNLHISPAGGYNSGLLSPEHSRKDKKEKS
jgi:hypothetical protein